MPEVISSICVLYFLFCFVTGTWVTFGNNISEETAEAIVQAAYDAGINVFDLSEAHCGVRAELQLGHILQRKVWKRASYIVTTKIYWNSKYVLENILI